MQTGDAPVDLSALRKARALAHPVTAGDRWADLHGIPPRPSARPGATGTVLRFRPGQHGAEPLPDALSRRET